MGCVLAAVAKLAAKLLARRCFDAQAEFLDMVEAIVRKQADEQVGRQMLRWIRAEGGVFIKMAQIVAQRPDVQANDTIRIALRSLQANCIAIPFSELEGSTELRDLIPAGAMVTDWPLSSASVAQVYELGTTWLLKVTLPSNEAKFARQFDGLQRAATLWILKKSPLAEVNRVAQVFKPMILQEFDMGREAADLERARQDLDGLATHVPNVVVPRVFGHTSRGLVMERFLGPPLTDAFQQPDVVKRSVRQIFDYTGWTLMDSGLVHCDPHSGNFILLDHGRLGVIDFGCVAKFGEEERSAWRTIFSHLGHFRRATKTSTSTHPHEGIISEAMVILGFRTRHNTPRGLATLALDAFDSSRPPSLKAMERGRLGLSNDPAVSPLPEQPALVMRAVVLLGGFPREAGDKDLDTVNSWEAIAQTASA